MIILLFYVIILSPLERTLTKYNSPWILLNGVSMSFLNQFLKIDKELNEDKALSQLKRKYHFLKKDSEFKFQC